MKRLWRPRPFAVGSAATSSNDAVAEAPIKPRRLVGRRAGLFGVFLVIVLLAAALLNRQNLIDWWRLRHYRAPAAVAQLASQDTMTAYARKIFYVNHPAIDSKAAFNAQCPNNGGEQTIVLGCYHGDQNGIFLLHVTDSRLDGVEQVTAAHEMLHAAYDRLNTSERQQVDAMLLNYYRHDLHNVRILAAIAAYRKTEPHAVVNEMHSVFGTEIAHLPAGLEQYYARYFSDRAAIAAYAAQYQAAFTSRQATVAQDDRQLAGWKQQINNNEADLKIKLNQIDSQQASLTALRNSGNTTAYNAGVPVYNDLIARYNNEIHTTQNLISQYNQLVTERNAIALVEDQLANDLNASALPSKQ